MKIRVISHRNSDEAIDLLLGEPLVGEGVTCTLKGQKTPDRYYNLEKMIRSAAGKAADIACCGSCLDARGTTDEGTLRLPLGQLTEWTVWASMLITF